MQKGVCDHNFSSVCLYLSVMCYRQVAQIIGVNTRKYIVKTNRIVF